MDNPSSKLQRIDAAVFGIAEILQMQQRKTSRIFGGIRQRILTDILHPPKIHFHLGQNRRQRIVQRVEDKLLPYFLFKFEGMVMISELQTMLLRFPGNLFKKKEKCRSQSLRSS